MYVLVLWLMVFHELFLRLTVGRRGFEQWERSWVCSKLSRTHARMRGFKHIFFSDVAYKSRSHARLNIWNKSQYSSTYCTLFSTYTRTSMYGSRTVSECIDRILLFASINSLFKLIVKVEAIRRQISSLKNLPKYQPTHFRIEVRILSSLNVL